MNRINSFEVDHLTLNKGLYVSRRDPAGAEWLTTYDLRMKLPNQERLGQEAIHTLEHLLATYFRNDEAYAYKVIYFGPMGCLTGMYLILHGKETSLEILPLIQRAFTFAATFEGPIPGVSAIECGNYKLHDLSTAKKEAAAYLEVLNHITQEQLSYTTD